MLLPKVDGGKAAKWVTLQHGARWPSLGGKAAPGAMEGWILAHEVWPFFSSVHLY